MTKKTNGSRGSKTHGIPTPIGSLASQRLTAETVSMVREITRRMHVNDQVRDHERKQRVATQMRKMGIRGAPDVAACPPPPTKPTIDPKFLQKGKRYADVTDLQRAAQEVALAEWNDGDRPVWDRDGRVIRSYHPGPADLQTLPYLSKEAREGLRPWAENDARVFDAERAAIPHMARLCKWAEKGRQILSKLEADEKGHFCPGMASLHRLLDSPSDLAQIASAFNGLAGVLARKDRMRSLIAAETGRLLRREPTARETALASLLFGMFPTERLKISGNSCTTADVIKAEEELMRRATARINR